jgi:acid-sensing ion channel, other
MSSINQHFCKFLQNEALASVSTWSGNRKCSVAGKTSSIHCGNQTKASNICSISKDFHYDSYPVLTRFDGFNPKQVLTNEYPLKLSGYTTEGLKLNIAKDPTTSFKNLCLHPTFVVHSPFDFPDAFEDLKFCAFDYGKNLDILITPQVISTDSDLIHVAPEKRNCFFDGEKELEYFKTYTKLNCEMECYARYLNQTIKCTPFYFIRDDSATVCDLNKIKDIIIYADSTQLRRCNCLDRCDSVKYDFQVIGTRLKGNESREKRFEYATDEVSLSFRFKDSEFISKRRYQPLTVVEFLAQSGGLLGLFVGASVLSLVEVFYFFSLRIVTNILK